MAVHMFMKIDSVQGESEDSTHSQQIEVTGWNWGASQTGSAASGKGAGTGKASVNDLTYTAYVDRSVPTLLNMCRRDFHREPRRRAPGGERELELLGGGGRLHAANPGRDRRRRDDELPDQQGSQGLVASRDATPPLDAPIREPWPALREKRTERRRDAEDVEGLGPDFLCALCASAALRVYGLAG